MRSNLYFALFFVLFIGACTETQLVTHMAKQLPGVSKSQGNFKVGSPYKINGKWYRPRETYSFSETGIASWYGPNFHGKPTANGETFDMNELTAAHRTLQLPSLVRVTNLENGRSLIVRVNDRGPFKRGRIIDMSRRGAELLGFKGKGTAKVKVQILGEESKAIALAAQRGEDTRGVEVAMNEQRLEKDKRRRMPPAQKTAQGTQPSYQTASTSSGQGAAVKPVEAEFLTEPKIPGHIKDGRFLPDPVVKQVPVVPTNIYVQAGSFSNEANAIRLAESLKQYGNAKVYPAVVNNQQFFRVRLPAPNVDQADTILSRLADAGRNEAIIVVDQ